MMYRTATTVVAILGLGALAQTASAAPTGFQDRTLKVASTVTPENTTAQGQMKMAQCAAEKSGGKLVLKMFWNGSLGNELATIQQLRTGSIDMVLPSPAPITGIVPDLGILDLPFLFDNNTEARQVLDGKAGDWFSEKLKPVGMVNLGWMEAGFRHTTNNKHPITKWEDFQGIKLRVMQSSIFMDTFKALGANAVPMSFSEVYSALEVGAVDGQENPINNIENMKFNEVQKYMSYTRHSYTPTLILLSKKTWDSMSQEEQTTMKECAIQGRDLQRQLNTDSENKLVEKMKAAGLKINDVSPAELARIREKTKPVFDAYASKLSPEGLSLVMDTLKTIRGK